MLNTDLVDLINSGQAWAFVGAGASIDAGCPSWQNLVDAVMAQCNKGTQEAIRKDSQYKPAYKSKAYDKCFGIIEKYTDRPFIDNVVKSEIVKITLPGKTARKLADLPFAGYITTNYDQLLETALSDSGQLGWASIGNVGDELRKISGGVNQVVWHMHGAVGISQEKSKLVITDADYEDIYLEDSPLTFQLRSLLAHRRLVFFGFSFEDREVMRLLRRLGRLSNPANPIYAFVSGLTSSDREDMLSRYNIDVIPYQVIDGSHNQLQELLDVYSSLVLRRSLNFDQPSRPCPAYDPETTGMLIYNELRLRKNDGISEDIIGTLLRARALSLIKHNASVTIADLISDLDNQIKIMRHQNALSAHVTKEVENVVRQIIDDGLARIVQDDTSNKLELTAKGDDFVANQSATAERLENQFTSSILSRARALVKNDTASSTHVANAAESFFKDIIARRALGTAMAMEAPCTEYQSYQIVALLQALPEYMAQLSSSNEAIALSKLVLGVFSSPSTAEQTYIGLALQSRFGVHLLGYDPDTLRARTKELRDTAFLIDSSTLITFLAKSCAGHNAAQMLIRRLQEYGVKIATTKLLIEEVAEHASYALERVESGTGYPNLSTLKAATGKAGARSNAFIDGFINEASKGKSQSIYDYLGKLCDISHKNVACKPNDVACVMTDMGIYCQSFSNWEGFDPLLFANREELAKQIQSHRETRNTYKHPRQVKAEAEALIIIKNLRARTFKIDGKTVANAYFISHTRIIDTVAGSQLAITMRPESVLQLLTTISSCSIDELSTITNSLLWELADRGLEIVDSKSLHLVFGPLVYASKESLSDQKHHYRVLIAQQYGEDGNRAFNEANDLYLPIALDSLYAQQAKELESELLVEQKKTEQLKVKAYLTEKERNELEILRAEKTARKQKARKNGHSNKKKKKKK